MEYHREAIVTSEGTKSKKKHTATKRDKRRCIHYNKKGVVISQNAFAWEQATVQHMRIDAFRYIRYVGKSKGTMP